MNVYIFLYRFRSTCRYGFGIKGSAIVSGQGTLEQVLQSVVEEVSRQKVGRPTFNVVSDIRGKQVDVINGILSHDLVPLSGEEHEKAVQAIWAAST